jgi:hypothetical protein
MNADDPGTGLLERLTGAVLVMVIAALGWMVIIAYQPEWGGGLSNEVQVIAIVALLAAALVLVSIVALLRTR